MENKRRKFIRDLAISGLAICNSPLLFSNCTGAKRLNILVLGGTNFLGPAIVKALSAGGHDVTLFNRGKTNPHLFPGLRKIKGDRKVGITGYAKLARLTAHWDVVVDVWPQHPDLVKEAIGVLRDKTTHYVYISSIAAYRNYKQVNMEESAARRTGSGYEEGNYNLNKALCEELVEKNFPDNFTIFRPGAIVGDRDPGPFGIYLLNRLANRKEIFAPEANDPMQIIDAQDIGNFLNRCLAQGSKGYFNLVGPADKIGYKDMITRAIKALESKVEVLWMPPDFLTQTMGLEPFSQIPFWIPLENDPEPGFYQISNQKAIRAGLEFTCFEETVRLSYASFEARRFIPEEGSDLYFGISNEAEDKLIKKWKTDR